MKKVNQAVSSAQLKLWRRETNKLLSTPEKLTAGGLEPLVKNFYLKKKSALLKLAQKHATPFYVFDRPALVTAVNNFEQAFGPFLPKAGYYYAVKVNPHPWVLQTVVKQGFGLDVSSSRELKLALKAKAKKMVFSGPGKTEADLQLALKYRSKVIIHLDSLGELKRLGKLTSAKRQKIKAGVRIFTSQHGIWNKFGIPLKELKAFFNEAVKYPNVQLAGIQFHLSWNASSEPYQNVLKELAIYLKKNLSARQLSALKFIDIGGGFLPYRTKGDNPWGASAAADLMQKAGEYSALKPKFLHHYYLTQAVTLSQYAQGIGQAIKKHFAFLPGLAWFAEPGRVIANNSMHLVMRVADVKAKDKIIMDAGVNIVGWEGLRYDYTPLINLNHFSFQEKSCLAYGCLCMADDVWSYSIYAGKITEGDVTAIPNFGAYGFTLAQEFIKDIPKVYPLTK